MTADPHTDDGMTSRPTVRALCSRCFHWPMSEEDRQYEMRMAMLVSPRGVAHHAEESEMTYCGKDATNWWWWC